MAIQSSYDLTNLMIPAFGAVKMITNKFNQQNGYVLDINQVNIDDVTFRPQSCTIDCSDVPSSQTVLFNIQQIGYRRKIQGGNTVTFNFPSIPNLIFNVTPSDGISEVRGFFFNFPSFTDFEGVQQVSTGGGGTQSVSIDGVTVPVPVANVPGAPLEVINGPATNLKVDIAALTAPNPFPVSDGIYQNYILNNEVLTTSVLINISAGGGLPASSTILAAVPGQRYCILDVTLVYLNLTFNNSFVHTLQAATGTRLLQKAVGTGLQNMSERTNFDPEFLSPVNSAISLTSEVISAVTSSTAGFIRVHVRYALLP